jgi:transposase
MSDDCQRIELITGTARRRPWTMEQKLRIIEASCEPGESVSSVARRHGVARPTASFPDILGFMSLATECYL